MKKDPQGKSRSPQRRSTLSDLARELKVDTSTISLALRDSPKVSLAMKKKIRVLAQRRGYVPNAHARALAGGRSSLLGVILPCAGVPFYSMLLDLLHEQAGRHGLRVEAQFHQWDTEREISSIRSMVEHRAEGIVAFSSLENPPKVLQEELFMNAGIPIAFWGRQPAGSLNLKEYIRGFVTANVRLGARMAAEHLLSLGHRRIALLLFERGLWLGEEKALGITEAMESYPDAELVPVLLQPSFSSAAQGAALTFAIGECVARQFLRIDPLPTAVMTTDDTAAQVLMSVLHQHGLRVPEDISVASSGNTYYSRYGAVPLSCIDVPLDQVAEKLVGLVTGPPIEDKRREYVIQPHFVPRSSTAAIAPSKMVQIARRLRQDDLHVPSLV